MLFFAHSFVLCGYILQSLRQLVRNHPPFVANTDEPFADIDPGMFTLRLSWPELNFTVDPLRASVFCVDYFFCEM